MTINFKISTEVPPIYDAAIAAFGKSADFNSGAVYAYGDTIHVQNGLLSGDLIAHESTHLIQQSECPGGAEAWWKRYLEDSTFRMTQEVEAYSNQWTWVKKHVPKRKQFDMLKFFGTCLSEMYGFNIGTAEAISLIKLGSLSCTALSTGGACAHD